MVQHVYEINIKATPEAVWNALTKAEFTRQYFHATCIESDWRVGSRVQFTMADSGDPAVDGEVLEVDKPRRLSYTWKVHYSEEGRNEPASRVTFEIEPQGEGCRLSLVHDRFEEGSKVYESIRVGWAGIFQSLKSLLETGVATPVS